MRDTSSAHEASHSFSITAYVHKARESIMSQRSAHTACKHTKPDIYDTSAYDRGHWHAQAGPTTKPNQPNMNVARTQQVGNVTTRILPGGNGSTQYHDDDQHKVMILFGMPAARGTT